MVNNIKDINDNFESPFILKISFNKLLKHYEDLSKSEDQFIVAKARRVLETQSPYPILREGFSDISLKPSKMKSILCCRTLLVQYLQKMRLRQLPCHFTILFLILLSVFLHYQNGRAEFQA